MGVERLGAEDVPATTRALAEVLAAAVGVSNAASATRIEYLVDRDGTLLELWKHERFGGRTVDRVFNELDATEIAEELRRRISHYRETGA